MCFICASSVLRMRWYLSGSGTSILLAFRNARSSISCAVRMVGTFSSTAFPTGRCYITMLARRGGCRPLGAVLPGARHEALRLAAQDAEGALQVALPRRLRLERGEVAHDLLLPAGREPVPVRPGG